MKMGRLPLIHCFICEFSVSICFIVSLFHLRVFVFIGSFVNGLSF